MQAPNIHVTHDGSRIFRFLPTYKPGDVIRKGTQVKSRDECETLAHDWLVKAVVFTGTRKGYGEYVMYYTKLPD
jgi:hypothetical protein